MSGPIVVYEYEWTRRRVAETPANVRTPADAADVVARFSQALIGNDESESLLVLCLNTRNDVMALERVYKGNVSASLVRVGELFRAAVRLNAAGIILVHNHPSGDPTPSPDDLHLTAQVQAAGRLLDIDLLDHIIVAEHGWRSLRDSGITFDRRT